MTKHIDDVDKVFQHDTDFDEVVMRRLQGMRLQIYTITAWQPFWLL